MSKNVILFSTADWDNPFWTNKQHTAVHLANRGFKVLYIESLGLRQPTLKSSDLSRIFKRIVKFFRGAREVRENIFVYSPLVIPFHRFSWVRKFNDFLLVIILRYFQKKLTLDRAWIWTYNPMVLNLAKALHGSKLIYHSVDDLSAAPGVDARAILRNEELLLKSATIVFCTSRKIEAHCNQFAKGKTYYFGNVVDYNHFSKARGALDIPSDLKNIPEPRIGFIGALSSYKVDVLMIRALAKQHPEWNWVLIGKIGEGQPDTQMEALKNEKNIHFLGPKSTSELPAYLKYFQTAIIPSPINEYTQSMFPMKFFEYMAAGKPIVASKLHALKEHEDYFYPYTNPEEFEHALKLSFTQGVKNAEGARALAQENTWEKRLDKMLKLIEL